MKNILLVLCTEPSATKADPKSLVIFLVDLEMKQISETIQVDLNNVDGKGGKFFFENRVMSRIVQQYQQKYDVTRYMLFVYDLTSTATIQDGVKQSPAAHAIGFEYINSTFTKRGLFTFQYTSTSAENTVLSRFDHVGSYDSQIYVTGVVSDKPDEV